MTLNDHDSLTWASRFKSKDKHALAEAIDYYGPDIQRLVKRILAGYGGTEDAEECVSDVFLAAWNGIERYDSARASFRTWLFLLTKYKALDLRRKLLTDMDRALNEEALNVQSGSNTEQEILQREAAGEMLRYIQLFSEPDRSLFLRRYYLYESLDELATAFNLSKKAVENRLYRCRTMLRQALHLTDEDGRGELRSW